MQVDNKAQNSNPNNAKEKQAKPQHPNQVAVTPSSSTGKWVVTVVVLIAAAVAGAWYMGMLDKYL